MDALTAGEELSVGDLADPVGLPAGAPLSDALHLLDLGTAAVAVTGQDGRLVGWLGHREALQAVGTTAGRPWERAAPPTREDVANALTDSAA
ncbi:CBS domain-containing protein [Nocardioides rubriscoriae]|uniref:CBS domain-containing protein n=1 Tax=Nocardioides rubriscoriae TaxID=642762 RepID=UPI001B87114F|nr:CBS domain-containing protein [Nocardioides rubriscoriae]